MVLFTALKNCAAVNLLRKVNRLIEKIEKKFEVTEATPKGEKGVIFFAREIFGCM